MIATIFPISPGEMARLLPVTPLPNKSRPLSDKLIPGVAGGIYFIFQASSSAIPAFYRGAGEWQLKLLPTGATIGLMELASEKTRAVSCKET